MPVTVTYPGVYVEEIPSGVRSISGVNTSTAAFIGWAARGPVDRARRISSFQDFARHFGGLDGRSLLGHSVQHFFANGGHDAYIVRLAADNALTASVTLSGALTVEARSPGNWGKEYSVEIVARSDDASRFRLAIWHTPSGQPPVVVESFDDLSLLPEDPRSVTSVLGAESSLVQAALFGSPATPPADTPAGAPASLVGGDDGDLLVPNTAAFESKLDPATRSGGLFLLDQIDGSNLLCVPGETNPSAVASLQKYCRDKGVFAILDSIENTTLATMKTGPDPALTGADALNSALYFPWVKCSDPLQENHIRDFPPCGFIAGLYARSDRTRGVWEAPAGSDATLIGAAGAALALTDGESRILNSRGINSIRTLPGHGTVAWGSRTLHGADQLASEWKYVPVRRLALYIEESLFRGTKWAVFEPNDEPLWAQIRLNVGTFMHDLFMQGAFPGTLPRDAYFVKCDKDTTTQNDIDQGVVNIVVGFAPIKPAEFVVITIQQIACRPVETGPSEPTFKDPVRPTAR
jgi:phage tail sheath protein FI